MTKLERNILKTIKQNLIDASNTSWTSGDHDQWVIWARKMKNTINSETAILETLLSEITNPISEPELPEEGNK